MNYKQQLFPWCIINPLPNMQTRIVGRFRCRSDAEGHLQVLRRMIPTLSFEIMFDVTPQDTDAEDNPETLQDNDYSISLPPTCPEIPPPPNPLLQ